MVGFVGKTDLLATSEAYYSTQPATLALSPLDTKPGIGYNRNTMQEVIPGTLLDKNKAKEFVIWLKALPLDIEDKRTLLRLWVDRVGVRITGGITTRAGLN